MSSEVGYTLSCRLGPRLVREARQADPRYASLTYPQPLGVDAISAGLDPGTLVLLYSVDSTVTRLFVFGPGVPATATEIPLGEAELRAMVGAYLAAIGASRALEDRGAELSLPAPGDPPIDAGAELARALLGGIGDALADAERLLILRDESPGRRIVHIATHGLMDPYDPLESCVVLTVPETITPENDGRLKAREAMRLDLRGCDLVALSACESARGELLIGEGVVGLTRAFMYAGAASVLCAQWPVADQSTAALMYRFYCHYSDGRTKDVALATAMREIRTGKLEDGSPMDLPPEFERGWRPEWAHPYYWAPFILVGEYLQAPNAN